MKDQIIAKFKAKFPAVTLSNKRLDEIADRLSKKVTNEEEIDAKLDEMNELMPFADIQKSDDKIRDLNGKLKATTTKDPTSQDQSTSTTKKEGENVDDNSGLGQLAQELKLMREELSNMKKKELQQTMLDRVMKHDKLKGIPDSRKNILLKGRQLPENDEAFETFVDGFKADYDAFVTEENNEGLINGHKPAGGGSSGPKPGISSDMKEYLAAKKTAEAASNKN
jgi:hypothetical protein